MPASSWNDFVAWWLSHWTWVFWVLMSVVAGRLFIRWHRLSGANSKSLPEAILRLRFVRGEIDKAEFKRRLNQVKGFMKSRHA